MDSAKVNDWMQVIGIFAVVASLLFVGLQMKQTQDIALAGQYQARAQTTLDFYLMNMESSQGQNLIFRPNFEEVTPTDITYAYFATNYFWTKYDNHHFQYLSGFLDQETWEGLQVRIKDLWGDCQIRWIYEENNRKAFRDSFNDYLDALDDPCGPEDNIRPTFLGATTLGGSQ